MLNFAEAAKAQRIKRSYLAHCACSLNLHAVLQRPSPVCKVFVRCPCAVAVGAIAMEAVADLQPYE